MVDYVAGDEIAGCKQFDIGCVCANDNFISGIACCVAEACDQSGQDATIEFAKMICSAEGVEIEVDSAEAACDPAQDQGEDGESEEEDDGGSMASDLTANVGTTVGMVAAAVAMAMAF